MNAIDIVDDLALWLAEILDGYKLLNKNGILQEIRIFRQYIPQPQGITFQDTERGLKGYDESDYEANFPCVIVKCGELTDKEENRIDMAGVNIKLLFGVYDASSECQGWRDICGMMDKVRYHVLTDRILARKYLLRMPVMSGLIEADTWPLYFGEMKFTMEAGRPRRPHDYVYRSEVYR